MKTDLKSWARMSNGNWGWTKRGKWREKDGLILEEKERKEKK